MTKERPPDRVLMPACLDRRAKLEQIAQSRRAWPGVRLRHVALPSLTPFLLASLGLSSALSIEELGAAVMVYPPGQAVLPVGTFRLSDRGEAFQGAALTVLLVLVTLFVWIAV
jgi:2-aminoethylphosphonate transport system permease protein